jgi:hypothetical protein
VVSVKAERADVLAATHALGSGPREQGYKARRMSRRVNHATGAEHTHKRAHGPLNAGFRGGKDLPKQATSQP